MYDLAGKVAVITGVGRPLGIGRATAVRFAREGTRLVIADLGRTTLQAKTDVIGVAPDLDRAAAEVKNTGAEVLAVPADVSNQNDVDALVQRAIDHFGQIDIMVCNAAILADRNAKPTELSAAVFDRVLAVNLKGTFLCAQAAARHMIERGQGGKIITVGSRAARHGKSNRVLRLKVRGDRPDAKFGAGTGALWYPRQLCLPRGGGHGYVRPQSRRAGSAAQGIIGGSPGACRPADPLGPPDHRR
jgi:NAD(P)-dependent dehydrogenase (short-subunit alcohol dehydrogenase family)